MAVNKVEINGETKLDLTQDTVTPETLLPGVTAHSADGNAISGAASVVRYDTVQSLSTAQKQQARSNIGAAADGDFATKTEAQGYVTDHNQSSTAHSDIREALAKLEFEELTEDEVQTAWDSYPPPPAPSTCLAFKSPSAFSISVATPGWDGTMEYSTNQATWTTWTGSSITAQYNDGTYALYVRGTGNTKVTGSGNPSWTLTGSDISCEGNIENLLDYATVAAGNHPEMADYCYSGMFAGCTGLAFAGDLVLPATTLVKACYYSMFSGCTSLASAPALPATTLDTHCYMSMFSDCASLITAPALPAMVMYERCYTSMFYGCTSLLGIPALPATKLGRQCYSGIFNGCTSIKLSATKTGTYTQAYRVPTSGTGTTAYDALSTMFTNTGGTYADSLGFGNTYYLDESNTIVS